MTNLSERLDRSSLYIALLVAWVATLGSLYFSEVRGYLPCDLCWYQRIMMYPLTAVLAVGLVRRHESLPLLVLPQSILGMGIALYHYLLEKTDIFPPHVCRSGVPCTTQWINWFGFVTIPFLSLLAFTLITVMCVVAWQAGEPYNDRESPRSWLPVGGVVAIGLIALVWLFTGASSTANIAISSANGVQAVAPSTIAQAANDPSAWQLYEQACASCHGANGAGVNGLGSALSQSNLIKTTSDEALLAMIRVGRALDDPQNTSGLVMPPSGGRPDLTDEQMKLVIQVLRSF